MLLPLLGPLAFGDVLDGTTDLDGPVLDACGAARGADPDMPSVRRYQFQFQIVWRALLRGQLQCRGQG